MGTTPKRRIRQLDLARLHEVLRSACAACSVAPGNPARNYAAEFQEFHRRAAAAPPTPRVPTVRVGFDSQGIHAALAAGCGCWQEETAPAKDYALRYLPTHQVGAGRLDKAVELLCDLRFVEARCRVGQVFELIADYRLARENLPEAQEDLREERAREERVQRWTTEIIDYARQWSNRRNRLARGEAVTEPEPKLPEPVPTCEMWSEERIQAECERIIQRPTRRDRLEAFGGFVSGQCYALLEHGQRPGFVLQHAFNTEPGDLVHDAAMPLLAALTEPHVLRRWPPGALPNPKPALLRTLTGHGGEVDSVSVTPDGRWAVSGSNDETVRVWNLESGQCLRTLTGHSREVSSLSVTPDGRRVVSGSLDHTLRVWDLESGQCLLTLTGHSSCVTSVSVTPDGRRVVSGSLDHTLRVWDLESGQCLRTLTGHSRDVSTEDGQMSGWYPDLRMLPGRHSRDVSSLSVTPDGRRAVSGSLDHTLRVWDLESGQCLLTLTGHSSCVTSVSVTPDGRRAVSGSLDNTVRVWNLASGQCLGMLTGHSRDVRGVRVTPDGRRAVSGSWDGTVRIWNLVSGQCLHTLEGHTGFVESVGVTPDGRRAVSGSWDGTVRIWDLASGQCLRTLTASTVVSCVSVTSDGRRAVSASADKTLQVWDLASGQCLRTLTGHSDLVRGVSVTPDGRRAVSRSADKTVRVWDLASGQCLRTLTGHSGWVRSVRVTPDGRRAISGSLDHTVRVWDLASGKCLQTLTGHGGPVSSVSMTPDGLWGISGSADKTVRVWDLASGKCLQALTGHRGCVESVGVTSDGRRAISGSFDGTVRVWDLASGRCFGLYPGSAFFLCAALNGAGNVICAGTETGEVLFLELHGVPSGPAILTAANPQQARCPVCGQEFAPPPAVVVAIQEESREAGVRSQNLESSVQHLAPRFLSPCPHCQHPLQFNPFFAAADDYAEVLRRGLEETCRDKGNDLELMAHVVALVMDGAQWANLKPPAPSPKSTPGVPP